MIAWLDESLLTLLIGAPMLGAFFALLLPGSDRPTLRAVGMGATLFVSGLAIYAASRLSGAGGLSHIVLVPWLSVSFPLFLDGTNLAAVLAICAVCPMALRGGAPRSAAFMKGHVLLVLAFESFALCAALVEHATLALTFLAVTAYPVLLLTALFGGQHKGSTGYKMAIIFSITDILCLAGLTLLLAGREAQAVVFLGDLFGTGPREGLLFMLLIGACGARLCVFPLSSSHVAWLEEAPVTVTALFAGGIFPLAAYFGLRWAVFLEPGGAHDAYPVVAAVALFTGVYAAVHVFIERDLLRYLGAALALAGAQVFVAICSGLPSAVAAALSGAACAGIAAASLSFVIDAIERRFYTRDADELFSLSDKVPALWRLFLFSGAALIGVPGVGFGVVLPALLLEVGQGPAPFGPLSSLWLVAGLGLFQALLGVGLFLHLKRMLHVPEHRVRPPAELTRGQTLRLFIPLVVGLLGAVYLYAQLGDAERAVRDVLGKTRPPTPSFPGEAP